MEDTSCSTDGSCHDTDASATASQYAFVTAVVVVLFLLPTIWRMAGVTLGWYLRKKTQSQRQHVLAIMAADEERYAAQQKTSATTTTTTKTQKERSKTDSDDGWEKVDAATTGSSGNGEKARKEDKDFDGIVGFFHPFCNAGGGGERVLWAAIRATQQRWPKAKCVVYTGDHDAQKDDILKRVQDRFNIPLHSPTITFLYLSTRHWVLASTWPHFTLAGQSLGSIIMAWDAFSLLVPDLFIDTMGYAFALGFAKFLFHSDLPTGAYVHYPTISTDMLQSLDPTSKVGQQGVNAGQGVGTRGQAKRLYWQLFAWAYARVGASVDVVMTNSTWTQGHIQRLWGPQRKARLAGDLKAGETDISVVYPPVAVTELEETIQVSEASEKQREPVIVYIAQFRPEKNHHLILTAFAKLIKAEEEKTGKTPKAKLVLIGSVRDDHDSKKVYQLRLLANELCIRDAVDFQTDAPWPDVLRWLQRASVGVNGMWNEHFGIGVVEYQAAGLISVVHDSGGPKLDIVTTVDGLPTGFHATTADEFADAFAQALAVPDPLAWRKRARQSALRFTEEAFVEKWIQETEKLVALL